MNTNTKEKNLELLKKSALNPGKAIGSEVLTVGASVVMLSTALLDLKPTRIECYVDSTITTKALRYTIDGSTPAAGTGIARYDNDEFAIEDFANLQRFKAIREAAGTHTIYITYFR